MFCIVFCWHNTGLVILSYYGNPTGWYWVLYQGSYVVLCHIGTTQAASCSGQFVWLSAYRQREESSSMNRLINGGNTSLWKRNDDFLSPLDTVSLFAWSLVKRAWACATEINCIWIANFSQVFHSLGFTHRFYSSNSHTPGLDFHGANFEAFQGLLLASLVSFSAIQRSSLLWEVSPP